MKTIFAILMLAAMLLAACQPTEPGKGSQIANPASEYCAAQGGALEIVTAGDGSQTGICTLKSGEKCEEWAFMKGDCPVGPEHFSGDKGYAIAKIQQIACTVNADCELPGAFAVLSHCPYTMRCIDGKCNVICPFPWGRDFDSMRNITDEDKQCSECPLLSPPGPNFCKNGTIVAGGKNECGCQTPPSCDTPVADSRVYCTEEQKKAQICTMEYMPVCGDDGVTYGNKCGACAAYGVKYHTPGECANEPKFCTEDAKVCGDGSAVSRDPENNCEFPACPGEKYYVVDSKEECMVVKFMCKEGMKPFFDDAGCGCEPEEQKEYISTNVTACAATDWICETGKQQFFDDTGCGCEPDGSASPGGKLQATDCTEPRTQACTKEYMPVCGQVQVQCIRAPCPPVMQTFSNKCEACANGLTISWVPGACSEIDDGRLS